METSKEAGDEKNREYFQRQKLPWLRTFLQERGIQTSCDGIAKRKADLVELALNAYTMKLAKVSDGESEDTNALIAELLTTDEGALPEPATVINFSRNLSCHSFLRLLFLTSVIICFEKADEYSAENLKSLKSLTGYRLFKDGHVMDLKLHKVSDKSYLFLKINK